MPTQTKQAADATQAEVYALYAAYGGYLAARQRSQLDHLLAEMSYPEQAVGDVRAEVGDALYFPACRAVATTSIRLPEPGAPTICAPRSLPLPRSASILTVILPAPG